VSTETEDLQARVRRLEDMAAIQQLFIDYGAYLDAHDFESYATLFAEEGEVLLGPLGRAKGPQEIRALMEGTMPPGSAQSFHVISNPVVTLDGDRARTQVMWTVIQPDGSGRPQVGMFGHHRDELVRVEGRWKFLRRAGYVDIPSAYPSDR
jgi:3-phenylpropionate/cinnamic acid dioxygenase small subunit